MRIYESINNDGEYEIYNFLINLRFPIVINRFLQTILEISRYK